MTTCQRCPEPATHRLPDGQGHDGVGWCLPHVPCRPVEPVPLEPARGGPMPGRAADALPMAHRTTAWRAIERTGAQGGAAEVHVAVRCWATGFEHDVHHVSYGDGTEPPIAGRSWVVLQTEHGDTFRVPAEHTVVLA